LRSGQRGYRPLVRTMFSLYAAMIAIGFVVAVLVAVTES
jgi:hypothetical protein